MSRMEKNPRAPHHSKIFRSFSECLKHEDSRLALTPRVDAGQEAESTSNMWETNAVPLGIWLPLHSSSSHLPTNESKLVVENANCIYEKLQVIVVCACLNCLVCSGYRSKTAFSDSLGSSSQHRHATNAKGSMEKHVCPTCTKHVSVAVTVAVGTGDSPIATSANAFTFTSLGEGHKAAANSPQTSPDFSSDTWPGKNGGPLSRWAPNATFWPW